jgi:hypothetical protein
MKPHPVAAAAAVNPRATRALVLTVAVLLLAGCGSAAATGAADEGAPSAANPSAAPVPAGQAPASLAPATSSVTPSTVTTAVGTPPASTVSTPSGDVTAAAQSALGLYEKVPRNPQDASAGYVWGPVSDTTGHLLPAVTARLDALRGSGYFSDRACAEEYLTGTQNGLPTAPTVLSAHEDAGGTVTVVIRRPATPAPPDLTVVMTHRNGVWLASDLASGSGATASIFATKPHC